MQKDVTYTTSAPTLETALVESGRLAAGLVAPSIEITPDDIVAMSGRAIRSTFTVVVRGLEEEESK